MPSCRAPQPIPHLVSSSSLLRLATLAAVPEAREAGAGGDAAADARRHRPHPRQRRQRRQPRRRRRAAHGGEGAHPPSPSKPLPRAAAWEDGSHHPNPLELPLLTNWTVRKLKLEVTLGHWPPVQLQLSALPLQGEGRKVGRRMDGPGDDGGVHGVAVVDVEVVVEGEAEAAEAQPHAAPGGAEELPVAVLVGAVGLGGAWETIQSLYLVLLYIRSLCIRMEVGPGELKLAWFCPLGMCRSTFPHRQSTDAPSLPKFNGSNTPYLGWAWSSEQFWPGISQMMTTSEPPLNPGLLTWKVALNPWKRASPSLSSLTKRRRRSGPLLVTAPQFLPEHLHLRPVLGGEEGGGEADALRSLSESGSAPS